MANITIYLPDAVEQKVRGAAEAADQPVSRWISERLVRDFQSRWPQEFLDAAGSDPNFPEIEVLRSGYGPESPREEFK